MTAKPQNRSSALLDAGEKMQDRGDHRGAIKRFDAVIKLEPENVRAHLWKGHSLYMLDEYLEAIASADRALGLDPDDAEVHILKGRSLQAVGEHPDAIASLDRALGLDPDEPEAHFLKGLSVLKLQNRRSSAECRLAGLDVPPLRMEESWNRRHALACLERALELDPDDADAYALKGQLLHDLGDYGAAIECLDRALELEPDDSYAHSMKGRSLRELGEHRAAVECFDRMLETVPGSAYAHGLRGMSLAELGDCRGAIASFDRALEREEGAHLHCMKGRSLQELGEHRAAAECLERSMELDPGLADAYRMKGRSLQELGEHRAALECFDGLAALLPDDPSAPWGKGLSLQELGSHGAAVECFASSIRLDPSDAYGRAYNMNYMVLRKFRDRRAAMTSLDCAIREDPECLVARVLKAALLRETGMPRDALAELDGFEIGGDGAIASWALCHKAAALHDYGMAEAALSCLDAAAASSPDRAKILFIKGTILDECGEAGGSHFRLEEAVRCYTVAIRADPGLTPARFNRGLALHRLGRPEHALASFAGVIALDPDFAGAYGSYGSALADMGRHADALPYFDRSLDLEPDSAEVMYNRARSLYSMDRIEESLRFLDEAVSRNPDLLSLFCSLNQRKKHIPKALLFIRFLTWKPYESCCASWVRSLRLLWPTSFLWMFYTLFLGGSQDEGGIVLNTCARRAAGRAPGRAPIGLASGR